MFVRLAAVAAFVAAPAAAADLAQVQAHLRSVGTMTADFSQTDQMGKTLTGTLTLKQPGRIRFQYQPGVPLLIVGDGHALTMIDYKVAQVSRWPVGDSPLALLINPSRDISRYAHIIPSGRPDRLLVEGRDPKHPEFGTITIGFTIAPAAPGGLVMAGWTVLDAQGNQSTVVLTNQKFNQPVSDRMFQWRDPRPQNRGH
ncbi:LolA family protein [Sphingomonas nostoxanthinifaciens]|uniref:LolA family protein n=1 Tax=Sphingomonas nostoxanthinifaciens TaxID=2872652 RepID=UPI001CC208F2|nr:outer membrane lipoprotein carrier protein LolA [Sphingomonas nostoxanthinifaciens]